MNPGTIKAVLGRALGSIRYRAWLAALLVVAAMGPAHAQTRPFTIAVFGDSLAAGYGLPADQAFPARLQTALQAQGKTVKVVNAGVSGDTTAGGKARLDWTLSEKPDLVILELGANDALRGLAPEQTEANLDAMLARIKQANIRVLLAGMLAPPNWGREYQQQFDQLFPRLARKHDVPLYAFFLDGVAADATLNQPDGIHPNAQGVDVIVARILASVLKAMQ